MRYGRLKPLDVEIMKKLGTRVNLIPVIAKADTMTPEDLQKFKTIVNSNFSISAYYFAHLLKVRETVTAQNIAIYTPPVDLDDEAAAEHARAMQAVMPFSIIGSTQDVTTPDGRVVKGREYLWGVAEGKSDLCSH